MSHVSEDFGAIAGCTLYDVILDGAEKIVTL